MLAAWCEAKRPKKKWEPLDECREPEYPLSSLCMLKEALKLSKESQDTVGEGVVLQAIAQEHLIEDQLERAPRMSSQRTSQLRLGRVCTVTNQRGRRLPRGCHGGECTAVMWRALTWVCQRLLRSHRKLFLQWLETAPTAVEMKAP